VHISQRCLRALPAALLLAGILTATGCHSNGVGAGSPRLTVAVGPAQAAMVRVLFAHTPGPPPRFVPIPAAGPAGLSAARRERLDLVVGDSGPQFADLVTNGVIARSWDGDSFFGLLATTVAAIAVRLRDPLHITKWAALRPLVRRVVLADPSSSDEAQAELVGFFGGLFRMNHGRRRARALVVALLRDGIVRSDPASARRTFAAGRGDAWLTTEATALAARKDNVPLTVIVPGRTMQVEVPIAVATTSAHRGAAQAAIDTMRDATHQRLLAPYGLRPVLDGVRDPRTLPTVQGLFKITRFGGWLAVEQHFFSPCRGTFTPPRRRRSRCGP
jgi:ABC-type sulfate transport system substrate-binding protein